MFPRNAELGNSREVYGERSRLEAGGLSVAGAQRGGCPLTPFTPLTSGARFALASSSRLLWVRRITPFPSTERERSRRAEPGCRHLQPVEMGEMDPAGLR